MSKISRMKVSILGATGMVGQKFVQLLQNHPWFDLVDLAASKNSAGKRYGEAIKGRWVDKNRVSKNYSHLIVRDVNDFESIPKDIKCVFSAIEMEDKKDTSKFEFLYARKGYAVISTNSANRFTIDVPIIIPEINGHHSDVIHIQQKLRNLPFNGFVVTKPNCSIQSYVIAIKALEESGYKVSNVQVTTLQALSGGGYRTLTDEKYKDNVIPFISGEEKKTESEPLKIFGKIDEKGIKPIKNLKIDALCTRVPISDGHTAIVKMGFVDAVPTLKDFKRILSNFKSEPQFLELPSAPKHPIVISDKKDRPQPKMDKNNENGMAITIGRIDKDKFFDIKFVGLSHNTIRGASGGSILVAELLAKKGLI